LQSSLTRGSGLAERKHLIRDGVAILSQMTRFMAVAEPTPSSLGRREANKDAVRTALRDAARGLFAKRGYEATTVREIAHAANVTERTFYRYFDGKEGLLAEESWAWVGSLDQAIRDRPGGEPPLTAVLQAMREVIGATRDGFGPVHLWLFSNQPRPFAAIRRFSPRPLVRLERAVIDALQARYGRATPGDEPRSSTPDTEFESAVLGRVAVAALRSAVIHSANLDERGDTNLAERLDATLVQAFEILRIRAA
jgi:AcrR family transcriptional regulator